MIKQTTKLIFAFYLSAIILFIAEGICIIMGDKGYLVRVFFAAVWFGWLLITCYVFTKYKEAKGWPWNK